MRVGLLGTRIIALSLLTVVRSATAQSVRLEVIPPLNVLRTEDSQLESDFGRIASVALLADGQVIVVDDRLMRVSVHSSSGGALGTLGGRGGGPGEFQVPRSVWRTSEREVGVLDVALKRVSRFSIVAGAVGKPSGSFRVDGEFYEACGWRSGQSFLRGVHGGHILHLMDSTGALGTSFGSPFLISPPIALSAVNRGPLVCLPETNRVIIASALLGLVRAFDGEGQLMWEVGLTGFRPTTISPVEGGIRYQSPSNGYHRIVSVVAVSPTVLAVQIGLEHPDRRDVEYASIETRLLQLSDGKQIGQQIDIPILMSTVGNRAVSMVETANGWELRSHGFRVRTSPAGTRD